MKLASPKAVANSRILLLVALTGFSFGWLAFSNWGRLRGLQHIVEQGADIACCGPACLMLSVTER
jgi:hypothetical protein